MTEDKERRRGAAVLVSIIIWVLYPLAVTAVMLVCFLTCSCSTPRTVYERTVTMTEADTLTAARVTQVMRSVARLDSTMRATLLTRQSTDSQQETLTETETIRTDSAGGSVRTLTRTSNRLRQKDEAEQQQQTEAILRLQMQQLDSIMQAARLWSVSFSSDSTATETKPAGGSITDRLAGFVLSFLLGAFVALLMLIKRSNLNKTV